MEKIVSKICKICGEEKVVNDFYKEKNCAGGYRNECKECYKRIRKEYRDRNNESLLVQKKKYYKENRDSILEYKRKYYDKNIEKMKEKNKIEYLKKQEVNIAKAKEYRYTHKEALRKWREDYYEKNKKRMLARDKTYRETRTHAHADYDYYAQHLTITESPRKSPSGHLEVKCAYCGKYFQPYLRDVRSRIRALKGTIGGELRLYCAVECKKECSIYGQMRYHRGFKVSSSREVQPELRQMVFTRDEWKCQKCGAENSLHCHHISPISENPIESADADNCITLCKKCHKFAHTDIGCRYFDLRCKKPL